MKFNFTSLIAALLLCLVSTVAVAKESSVFSVQVAAKNIVALNITNVTQPNIQISLIDADGFTIYNETLAQSNVTSRKFDLSNLPTGQYTLVATYDDVIKVQSINMVDELVTVESNNVQTIFKPTFRQHAEYVDLSMYCPSFQNVSIEMRDKDGNVVYSEINNATEIVQKRFNISQLEEGAYTLTLAIDGAVIYKEFDHLINWSPSK